MLVLVVYGSEDMLILLVFGCVFYDCVLEFKCFVFVEGGFYYSINMFGQLQYCEVLVELFGIKFQQLDRGVVVVVG